MTDKARIKSLRQGWRWLRRLGRKKPFEPPAIPTDWQAPVRVWDVFPYWREAWAVRARQQLWAQFAPDVEYMPVALLGDRTHRGNPLPDGLPEVPDGVELVMVTLDADTDWGREEQQRNAVRMLLPRMEPDDIVLLNDADEIVDPRMLPAITAMTAAGPIKLYMALWMCGTRWRNPDWWCHPGACRVRDLPEDPSKKLRLKAGFPGLWAAGWHLSYAGTDADVDAKLSAFAHSECDTAENRAEIAQVRAEGGDRVDDPLLGPLSAILKDDPVFAEEADRE